MHAVGPRIGVTPAGHHGKKRRLSGLLLIDLGGKRQQIRCAFIDPRFSAKLDFDAAPPSILQSHNDVGLKPSLVAIVVDASAHGAGIHA